LGTFIEAQTVQMPSIIAIFFLAYLVAIILFNHILQLVVLAVESSVIFRSKSE